MSSSSVNAASISDASAADLPAGTPIEIRLKTKIASNASKPHDAIEAVVIAPVMIGDQFVIPCGAGIRGQVDKVEPTGADDRRAELHVHFDQLAGPHGKTLKLAAKVTAVDNARESVDENGAIIGILGSETLSARMDQGLNKLGQRASGLAEILQIAKSAMVKSTDSEVVYEPGVEMTLQLTAKTPIAPGSVPGKNISFAPLSGEGQLLKLVNAQPFLTKAAKPPKESDMTNLMFIGSEPDLEAAFTEAVLSYVFRFSFQLSRRYFAR